jgi:hypothetical protein
MVSEEAEADVDAARVRAIVLTRAVDNDVVADDDACKAATRDSATEARGLVAMVCGRE